MLQATCFDNHRFPEMDYLDIKQSHQHSYLSLSNIDICLAIGFISGICIFIRFKEIDLMEV